MKQFKCVIIDDDSYAIDGLAAYISTVPNLSLVKSYENPIEALMEITKSPSIDLILMDIHMPQITGIQLSKEIRSKTQKLIFTTAYTQYGYEAFEVEADGYLLKPFSLQKFIATVSKVLTANNQQIINSEVEQYFFVKSKHENHKLVKVWFKDIVAVEGQQNYILIHMTSKKILTYMSLSEIGKYLAQITNFVQFQRSFIIAKSHIECVIGNNIRMDNGLEFSVGDKYRNNFIIFMNERLLKTGD